MVTQPTDGVDSLMFQQENSVAARAVKNRSDVLLLKTETILVCDGI